MTQGVDLLVSASAMRRSHLFVGVAGGIAFLLSGQYMHHSLGHLQDVADGPRLLYRSAHIYLLWSSLLNLALGWAWTGVRTRWRQIVHSVCSVAVLAGPPLMVCGFFLEPTSGGLDRPFTALANYLAFAGMLGLATVHARAGATPIVVRVVND